MNDGHNTVNRRQVLERIARESWQETSETAVVASPGARVAAWAVKVKSHCSYNVYNVIAVVIGDAGDEPTEIGQQLQAVNLAEPFQEAGTLSVGTHAIMFRVGDKNIFYAPV